jgi:hypothetical protein
MALSRAAQAPCQPNSRTEYHEPNSGMPIALNRPSGAKASMSKVISVTRKETQMNKFVAIAGSIVLASGMAFAGEGEGTDSKKFEDLDANQDGVITQSEAAAYQDLVAVFNEVDANADGYLTPSEFDSMKEETEDAE